MIIKVKEYLPVIIEKHPHYKSINKKLMEQIDSLLFEKAEKLPYYTNVRGEQYNFGNGDIGPTIKLIEKWITELIATNIIRTSHLRSFRFWFSRLNDEKGQLTYNHDHLVNATFGAVYFVNTPKGSSPLVFTESGKRIKAEEGKIVIFPASLRHKVPQNRCKNRITLSCNIGFGSL